MPEHGRISTYTNHKCRCAECREAWRQYTASYYRRKPEVMRSKRRRRYAEWKAFALEYLGGKCQACGSVDNLEFHHVDPDAKHNSITSMLGSSRERLVAELDKCDLLCRDCHWDKTRANGRVGRWRGHRLSADHGTTRMYYRGCRCDDCKAAMSTENKRQYLARKRRPRL